MFARPPINTLSSSPHCGSYYDMLENQQSNHSMLWQEIEISLKSSGRDAYLKVKFYKIHSEILLVLIH